MQKLLNEWRAYIREAKKPEVYRAFSIKCPGGAIGVAGEVNTTKGRKLVKFCPSESEAKADAGMKLHKKGMEQALQEIENSKEALAYLKEFIDEDIYGEYAILGDIENIISDYDPFDPKNDGFRMDVITKENYSKKFDSIIKRVYSLYDPFLFGMDEKLKKDINMQNKLADLYENARKLFDHVKEYHKARIAY